MKKNEKNSNSKVVYAVLGLSLLGQGTYIYKQAGDTKEIKAQIEESNKERSLILAELTKLNNSRDSILNQNALISKELILEREKVVNMIEEIKKSKKEVKRLKNSLFACKELERQNNITNNIFPNSTNKSSSINSVSEAKKDLEKLELKNKKALLKRKKDSLDNKIKSDKAILLAELKKKSDILKAKKDSIDKKIKADNERLLAELKKNNADLKAKQASKAIEELKKSNADLKANQTTKEKEIATEKVNLQEKQDLLEKEKKSAEEIAKAQELAKIKKETADKERYNAAMAIAEKAKKDAEIKKNELLAKAAETKKVEETKVPEVKKTDITKTAADSKKTEEAKSASSKEVASHNKKAEAAPVKKVEVLNPNETRLAADEKNKLTKNPETLEKLTKLNIQDLKSIGIKSATEDQEEIETILAEEVNVLRISFTIPQNYVVRSSERNYFIQVLDSRGNLVGENATVIFEDDSRLAYTFSKKVKYKNKAMEIVENMYYKNFKKGLYTVKVFDKSNLVSETKLLLR